MKKYFITFILISIFINLTASIYITVNDPDPQGQINCTTISEAISYLNDEDESYLIEVFAIDGEETIYEEIVAIPVCTVTLMVNEEDRGLVIIDSGTDAIIIYKGCTAITVLPSYSSTNPHIVEIDGFIIQRSDFDPDQEEDSGIVVIGRNTAITNCEFGSRDIINPDDDLNFYKSIYFETSIIKGHRNLYIADCELIRSCNIGEFSISCKSVGFNGGYDVTIEENNFEDCGQAIKVLAARYIKIIKNTLYNDAFFSEPGVTFHGIYATCAEPSIFNSRIEENKLFHHDIGIYIDGCNPFDILWNSLKYQKTGILIYGGNASVLKNLIHTYQDDYNVIGIKNWGHTSIKSNTLINTGSGIPPNASIAIDCGEILGGMIYNDYLANTIMWDYDTNVTYPTSNDPLEINYCCFNGSIAGFEPATNDCNLYDTDPLFISELPENEEFCHLTESSPCIDAGDPDAGYDPDGSPPDIGCFYYLHDYDTKYFEEGIHWLSFPMLTEQGIYNPPMNPYLPNVDEVYEHAYDEDDWPGLLQDQQTGGPAINGFDKILGKREEEMNITYNYQIPEFQDNDFNNMLFRHEGYKIEVLPGAEITELEVYGERLEYYELDMTELKNYWIGYYLLQPYSQNIEYAFGDFWVDVNKVWAEDWYYDRFNMIRGGDPVLSANSTKGKTMEYGKMYIVQMYDDVTSFHWNGSGTAEEPLEKAASQYFSYTEKADYEAIDVVNIPPNVSEIGVFEEDICVGAVVVEDSCAQILVYSENVLRDPVPFTFEVVTGRGISNPIKDYLVLNQMTGEFEPSVIISGRQDYSAIKFGEQEEPEDETPTINKPMLYRNYPNPFNPTTTIEFSLVQTSQFVTLEIFNIKGQKVKTLYKGIAEEGKHSVIWEGKDTNGKSVSSGIYFYKLKTGKKEISRKMLLLK